MTMSEEREVKLLSLVDVLEPRCRPRVLRVFRARRRALPARGRTRSDLQEDLFWQADHLRCAQRRDGPPGSKASWPNCPSLGTLCICLHEPGRPRVLPPKEATDGVAPYGYLGREPAPDGRSHIGCNPQAGLCPLGEPHRLADRGGGDRSWKWRSSHTLPLHPRAAGNHHRSQKGGRNPCFRCSPGRGDRGTETTADSR